MEYTKMTEMMLQTLRDLEDVESRPVPIRTAQALLRRGLVKAVRFPDGFLFADGCLNLQLRQLCIFNQ